MKARFKIGDIVTRKAFIDCFGFMIPAIKGLTVTQVNLIESEHIDAYFRIDAEEGFRQAEGPERFFILTN